MDSYTYLQVAIIIVAAVIPAWAFIRRKKDDGPPPVKPPRYTRTPPRPATHPYLPWGRLEDEDTWTGR